MAKEGGEGTSAREKKYSIESSKPLKFPTGETRPLALGAKSPGGTAFEPFVMIGTLSVYFVSQRGSSRRGSSALLGKTVRL